MLVDMRVVRGNDPVTDLRLEDVTLLVDGAPRPIVSLIYSPVLPPGDPSSLGGLTTKDAGRTGPSPRRRVVFVVDRESLEGGQARQFQRSTEDFIARLPSSVSVAVATLPLGSSIRFEPDAKAAIESLRAAFEGTTKRGAGLEGISGFGCTDRAASEGCGNQGIDPRIGAAEAQAMNREAEWLLRGRKALNDLQWLFRTLADGPSDVVIVSGALPYQSRLRPDTDRTFTVARTAGVRVHAVEVADLTQIALPEGGDTRTTPTLETLREEHAAAYGLPNETGGIEAAGLVSGAGFFKRLARELSSTYLLSFEPLHSDRDGKPHTIEVRTTRRPLPTIHARRNIRRA